MNAATASARSADGRLPPPAVDTLLGFRTFFRKELDQWWSSRAAIAVLIIATLLGGLSTLGGRLSTLITEATNEPIPADAAITLDATLSVLGAQWDQWLLFITIFASMGMMATERDRGTLSWSLSKPLSRSALLLAKWSAAMVTLGVFAIALPMLTASGLAAVAYGGLPDPTRVGTLALLLLTVPAFFLALAIGLGTRIGSQAAIAAIGLAVGLVPLVLGGLLPVVAQLWPTSIGGWSTAIAAGQPASLVTPVAWAFVIALIALIALRRFARQDL